MPVELLIKPEIGRTLYFHANGTQPHAARAGAGGPLAAKIVHVHGERMVNLVVWDANGVSFAVTSVELAHPEDATADRAGFFAAWMPWQIEQAERSRQFRLAQQCLRAKLEKPREMDFVTPSEVKAPPVAVPSVGFAEDNEPGERLQPDPKVSGPENAEAPRPDPNGTLPGPGADGAANRSFGLWGRK